MPIIELRGVVGLEGVVDTVIGLSFMVGFTNRPDEFVGLVLGELHQAFLTRGRGDDRE